MSKAYAMLCDVYALVMTKDPENVIETGIWGQVEKPTLQQTGNPGGQVNVVSCYASYPLLQVHRWLTYTLVQIDACDVDGSNIKDPTYWMREQVEGQKNIAVALADTTPAGPSVLTSSSYSSATSSSIMSDVRRRQKFPLTVLPHSIYTPEELGFMFSDIEWLW
jgi:hypothetical protein